MREIQSNAPSQYQLPDSFKAGQAARLRRIWKRIILTFAAVIAVPILFVVGYIIYLSCRHHTTVEEVKVWMATLPPNATHSDVTRLFAAHGMDWMMRNGTMRGGLGDADEGLIWKSDIWVDVAFDNNGRVVSIDVREHTLAP